MHPSVQIMFEIENMKNAWFQAVRKLKIVTDRNNANDIRAASNSMVVAARKLSEIAPLNIDLILEFFCRVSLRWLSRGIPLNEIAKMLPTDMTALGTMKMVEEAEDVQAKMAKSQ